MAAEPANVEIANCRRKRRYRSEQEAREAARQQMRMNLDAPDLEIYECLWCRGWHLTRGERDGAEKGRGR
jgi:hypothetical protein